MGCVSAKGVPVMSDVAVIFCGSIVETSAVDSFSVVTVLHSVSDIQGGARNVIPLIVHIIHFYCYKNI